MSFERILLSRRTCFRWLLSCLGNVALAQQAPVAYRAASSDSNKVVVEVSTRDLRLGLSETGHAVRVNLGPKLAPVPVRLCTVLANCDQEGGAGYQELPGGGAEFTRTLVHQNKRDRCRVTERFIPMHSSVRWEAEILGAGVPWSTAIETQLAWLGARTAQYWTTWGQPPQGPSHKKDWKDSYAWSDPLVFSKFVNGTLRYGGRLGDDGVLDEAAFSTPIVTVADHDREVALSVVQSPEDALLDMELQTTELGDAILRRMNHRISKQAAVRFSVDLVAHGADWRGGLGWMARRYSRYFEPLNQAAYQLDGCATYSGYQGDLDIGKLTQMAYSFNWNARFDFPFLGMNLPPIGPDIEWASWYQKNTSIGRMRRYHQQMKGKGFHVLEYFVITECGNYIQEQAPPRKAVSDADLWKDPNDFIHHQIPTAVLLDENGKFVFSNWFGNVVVDPADPAWQEAFLAQARHMTKEFPESDGICIDRLDWLASYNRHRDDGISWIDDKPASSFVISWRQALAKLGPILHAAGKCVFVNCLSRRIDSLEHVDGLYAELGTPAILNLASVMGSQRPVVIWTGDINALRPDPDAYFQRHLHLGAFITVPYPEADHTIAPDPWVDAEYLKYGPLFDALRGRRWVLHEGAVSCSRSTAKVNLFEVPGGFVLPITFGTEDHAEVSCNLPVDPAVTALVAHFLHPGAAQWIAVHETLESDGSRRFNIPLNCGCTMVRILYAGIAPAVEIRERTDSIAIFNVVKSSVARYTVDGSEPTLESPPYSQPFKVPRPTLIKAAIFVSGKQVGRTLFRQIYAT